MKKRFTLIEIITVIAILGILIAIIVPNFSDKKEIAMVTQVKSNLSSLQTAMDMYSYENGGSYASLIQPTLEEPQMVSFDMLYPKYLKNVPKNILGEYYWVDFMGKVWASTVDAPKDIFKSETSTEWNSAQDVTHYNVYKVYSKKVFGAAVKERISLKKTVVNTDKIDKFISKTDETLLVSSIDKFGLETAPVGAGYNGVTEDWFTPIISKEGTFYFSITADELMYWDGYSKVERKPEGTNIYYAFSVLDENGEYTEFTDDFYSLQPSTEIKVRITMVSYGKKLPSLLDIRIYYHFAYEDDLYKKPDRVIIEEENKISDTVQLSPGESIDSIIFPNAENPSYGYSSNGSNYDSIGSFTDIPSTGGYVNITSGKPNDYIPDLPIIKVNKIPQVVHDINSGDSVEEKPSIPPVEEKEWETVQELVFIASAGDGQIAHWISAEIEDLQPENTRILYRFATSNGWGWSNFVEEFSQLSDSRMLKVYCILQVKSEFIDTADYPEVISIKINSSRGQINLSKDKPTAAIKISTDNNNGKDTVTTTSNVTWDYESYDAKGNKITEVLWGGDKRDNYNTTGEYTVTLKVKNDKNQWSDEVKYSFEVKDEKPVAVISPNLSQFSTKSPIEWSYKNSYDPDGDKIVKAEWGGDYKTTKYEVGNYTIKLRVQDEEGNWSDWVEKNFTVVDSVFYNVDLEAIDKNSNTFTEFNASLVKKVYWNEDMSNRAIKIVYKNNNSSTDSLARISFYDEKDNVVPFQGAVVHVPVTELILGTSSGIVSSRIVNIPERAVYFKLYSNNDSYKVNLYEIEYYENDSIPNSVSNVNSTSTTTTVSLTWDNPSDDDFYRVVIFRDGEFIGYSNEGTYHDNGLKNNTEYIYTIQTLDKNENRGKEFVKHIAKTTAGEIEWLSNLPELFDKKTNSYVAANLNNKIKIEWKGNLTNRALKITYKNLDATNDSLGRISFYDSAGNELAFQAGIQRYPAIGFKLVSTAGTTSTCILNVPEDAAYFEIYNYSTKYNVNIYEIEYFENDPIPNPVSNVQHSLSGTSATLTWDNPTDEDFYTVEMFRDGEWIGNSKTGTYTNRNLVSGKTYKFEFQSTDKNGNRGKMVSHIVTVE